MNKDDPIVTFEEQDLGDLRQTIVVDDVAQSGVTRLPPNKDKGHIEALRKIRAVIDEHYGDRISDLAEKDEKVVITRLVVRSDDLPEIEYDIVPKRDDNS